MKYLIAVAAVVASLVVVAAAGTRATATPYTTQAPAAIGDSPTPTDSPSPTDSPTPTPTDSPSPTDSPTPTPTDTPSPTPTPTVTPTPAPSPDPTVCTVHVAVGSSIQRAVSSVPEGSTICLGKGTYYPANKIQMQSGDALVGLGPGISHINLSKIPVGNISAAAITWGGKFTGGTGVVDGLDIYGGKVNLNYRPRGCLAAIGGQDHMRITNSHLHNNSWGFAINSNDWYVADNQIDHNGKGDGKGGGHCQGKSVGAIKVLHHGVFLRNYIHDNTLTGIWFDVGHELATGEIANNRFANNGLQGDVTYEVSWGGLVSHDNVHSGGRAYDIESSANVEIYGDTMNAANLYLAYGPRALPLADCEVYATGPCDGTLPHDISVHNNTGIKSVVVGSWDGTQTVDVPYGPNGCVMRDPSGAPIPSVSCTSNT